MDGRGGEPRPSSFRRPRYPAPRPSDSEARIHTQKRIFIALQIVGGTAVLGSYVLGFVRWPDAVAAMWGGVPEAIRPAYTVWMFVAATGYFAFSGFFLSADPDRSRVMGRGYPLLHLLYGLVLVGSAAWLPLTKLLVEAPSAALWWGVRGVLYAVALGSLGILASAATLTPAPSPALRRAAVLGAVAFCFQTVLLDALVWPALFPAPG